jgi:Na+-driven multidrug efflux pump
VAMMVVWAIVCQAAGHTLVDVFTDDLAAIQVGDQYLHIVSFAFVASGLIFVASSMFQAMGNTMPSLVSSAVRIVIIVLPALLMARLPGFRMTTIWYLSIGGTVMQLGLSLWLLRREFTRRLGPPAQAVMAQLAS